VALPKELKGHDICRTIFKDYAERVKQKGKKQASYNHFIVNTKVELYKYCNEQYFMVSLGDNIGMCIWV
jgi:hypothetical protein